MQIQTQKIGNKMLPQSSALRALGLHFQNGTPRVLHPKNRFNYENWPVYGGFFWVSDCVL
jgi:hypothetical protein